VQRDFQTPTPRPPSLSVPDLSVDGAGSGPSSHRGFPTPFAPRPRPTRAARRVVAASLARRSTASMLRSRPRASRFTTTLDRPDEHGRGRRTATRPRNERTSPGSFARGRSPCATTLDHSHGLPRAHAGAAWHDVGKSLSRSRSCSTRPADDGRVGPMAHSEIGGELVARIPAVRGTSRRPFARSPISGTAGAIPTVPLRRASGSRSAARSSPPCDTYEATSPDRPSRARAIAPRKTRRESFETPVFAPARSTAPVVGAPACDELGIPPSRFVRLGRLSQALSRACGRSDGDEGAQVAPGG